MTTKAWSIIVGTSSSRPSISEVAIPRSVSDGDPRSEGQQRDTEAISQVVYGGRGSLCGRYVCREDDEKSHLHGKLASL